MKIKKIFAEQNSEFEELKKIANLLDIPIGKIIEHVDCKMCSSKLVQNEILINDIITKIRFYIQERNFFNIANEYRSPIYKVSSSSINSTNYTYDYERTIKYRNLEEKFHSKSLYLDGFTLFYRSGMSTITSIINLILKFYKSITCVSHIGYYESVLLLNDCKQYISNLDFNVCSSGVGANAEFYFIEFVKANFKFDTIDFSDILNQLPQKSNKLVFVVFDISFLGDSFNFDEVLRLLKNYRRLIIIFFRSGLKLDQQGLELINLGILSLYLTSDLYYIKNSLLDFMQENRSRTGLSLSLMDSFILNDIITMRDTTYSKKILTNTSYFISQLKISELSFVSEVICANVEYANIDYHSTPYFFIKLKDADEKDYINLCKLIKYEFLKVGLEINFRTSFGFRNISFEYVKNRNIKNSEVLKIAPGVMRGYAYYKMI